MMPFQEAGKRMEPPVSGTERRRSIVRRRHRRRNRCWSLPGHGGVFQGLRASGPLLGGPIIASSLMVSLPSMAVPASRRRSVTVASESGMRSLKPRLP